MFVYLFGELFYIEMNDVVEDLLFVFEWMGFDEVGFCVYGVLIEFVKCEVLECVV